MTLNEILGELYVDYEEPIRLLSKYHLEQNIHQVISEIDTETNRKPIDVLRIVTIASSMLVNVNNKLRTVTGITEKKYLETILRDVAVFLLEKIVSKSPSPERFIKELKSALLTTSSSNGYNFRVLFALLRLNTSRQLVQIPIKDPLHFQWHGFEYDLDDLLKIIQSEKWISATKEFRKLFSRPNQVLKIAFNEQKIPDLLALLDKLKQRKLISPKGSKGHFSPLKQSLVDLENNILFKKEPKVYKMIAKKKEKKWEEMLEKADSWISGYKIKKG
jgi:hypothetical protein